MKENAKRAEGIKIRAYEPRDLEQLTKIYKSAFTEQPWNEFMKCMRCGTNYGKEEVREASTWDSCYTITSRYEEPSTKDKRCKGCGIDLSAITLTIGGPYISKTNQNFVEFWSALDIKEDLQFAESQPSPIILIAEEKGTLVGFTWGYSLPLSKFPFLSDGVGKNTAYMDEIAVSPEFRKRGIATQLGKEFLDSSYEVGFSDVILRTDERNKASMNLFSSLGFAPVTNSGRAVYDPKFPNRVYLKKELAENLRA